MKRFYLRQLLPLMMLVGLLSACSPRPEQQLAEINLPTTTTQVLLVTTPDWEATEATLQRMEKRAEAWHPVGDAIPVRVGRNGLGWGAGLHTNPSAGVQKQEGDGKAPAGVFRLGTAFGYDAAPQGLQMPYRTATERDYFVDAVDSADYNQWRSVNADQPNTPKQHWASCERMRRDDHQYEYGMVVEHNTQPVTPGRGSAIFLHVWLDPQTPTSGCTGMDRAHLLEVLRWLQPNANPLLVQVPAAELGRLSL